MLRMRLLKFFALKFLGFQRVSSQGSASCSNNVIPTRNCALKNIQKCFYRSLIRLSCRLLVYLRLRKYSLISFGRIHTSVRESDLLSLCFSRSPISLVAPIKRLHGLSRRRKRARSMKISRARRLGDMFIHERVIMTICRLEEKQGKSNQTTRRDVSVNLLSDKHYLLAVFNFRVTVVLFLNRIHLDGIITRLR